MRCWACLSLLPVGLLALACSGSEDGAVLRISEDDVASEVAARVCDQQLSCDCYVLASPVGEDPKAYTRARCLENRQLELEHWQAFMTGIGFHYDAECLALKLGQAESWSCSDWADVTDLALEESCASRCRVYHGGVPAGEECSLDPFDDCAQGLRCRHQPNESAEPYADPVYRCEPTCGGIGTTCRGYGDECAPGLYCSIDYQEYQPDPVGSCQPLPTEGQDCGTYYTCAGSLSCSYQEESDSYRCVPLIEDGEACDPAVPCRGGCIAGTCEPGAPSICGWDARGEQSY